MTAESHARDHAHAQEPPEGIIENAADLQRIMADGIAQATAGKSQRAVYRARASLLKNLTVEVSARQFRFFVDEPPAFGGADAGPNPEEVVLGGVGACQVITAALYAAVAGIPIRRYDVQLRGYANLGGFYGAEGTPTGFERVVCDVMIESDATPEQLAAFERMVEARCVGHGTLQAPVAVETRWTINGQPVQVSEADRGQAPDQAP